ncbi:MAG: polysaccharide deacetylase family protein [Proteobacteria bacterium]|nr:polysaccharide deacetylase family protein [Pseudomonadota bacterium]
MDEDINHCLDRALKGCASTKRQVFFRADDLGVAGTLSGVLFETFAKHDAPLCPALVPAWLTKARWEALQQQAGGASPLWCWHQHGWRHKNHEPQGPRCEFGPARTDEELLSDMIRGRQRLEQLLGEQFTPVFTAPWNRLSRQAALLLPQAGFRALSRDQAQAPEAPTGWPEFRVNVDLHTRSNPDAQQDRELLLQDLERTLGSGRCGIMLHHQSMNQEAVRFLDALLAALKARSDVRLIHFGHLLADDRAS